MQELSGMTINVSQTCRDLGVMLDRNMTMSHQISCICRSVRYQLRNIGFIRKYLNRSSTEKLVHALISSRLDFGNSILFNLPQTQISILQRLQNAAARIITLSKKPTTWGTRAFAHAGPTLWNNLPSVIKHCSSSDSFKSGLKTHLFNASF